MAKFCAGCGAPLGEGAKFCPVCGRAAAEVPTTNKAQTTGAQPPKIPAQALAGSAQTAARAGVAALTEQLAAPAPGEVLLGSFGQFSGAVQKAAEVLSPAKTLLAAAKSFGQSFVGLFKNKRWGKIIPAGIFALIWFVLMLLSHFGIRIPPLDFLTFAQGGAGRNVIGGFFGLLGKAGVAAMFVSLFSGGFKHFGSGIRQLFAKSNFKTDTLGVLLLGAGSALTVYQAVAGSAVLTDAMAALSGVYFALQALGRGGGFVFSLAQSLTAKKAGKTRMPQNAKAAGLLTGATYGFALGGLLSIVPFGFVPVIFGGVCLLAGVVLSLVFGRKKEAAV